MAIALERPAIVVRSLKVWDGEKKGPGPIGRDDNFTPSRLRGRFFDILLSILGSIRLGAAHGTAAWRPGFA
ncbi:MAG: hypothetical protein J7521_14210 [Caulobacter sp.]|nr:hypothetical protein [Caulobacter sp.]